jgi:glutamine amidotransferase
LKKKIAIIDYGRCNLFSIKNALNSLGIEYLVATDLSDLEQVSKIILPGVGAFGKCIVEIKKRKLDKYIAHHINSGKPLLGICVGMQILFSKGVEYGAHKGLNFIEGDVLSIKEELSAKSNEGKIPNIGWYELNFEYGRKRDLFNGISPHEKFYFIHSYFCAPMQNANKLAHIKCYGSEIVAVVSSGNVYGVQFHPEKSGKAGLKFLQNFADL